MDKLIDRLPAAMANRLRSRFGTQFLRFVVVAVASLGASEIALAIFIGPLHVTAGTSGVSAAVVGAVVSYVLSRWAWRRRGRPNVLRETLPFWLVSIGAWLVLGLATKLGVHVSDAMHLHHLKRHLVVGGVYFVANCVTFVLRFLIFHYVLFADRQAAAGAPAGLIETESLSPVTVAAVEESDQDGSLS
jgi:putative flippase GtrA